MGAIKVVEGPQNQVRFYSHYFLVERPQNQVRFYSHYFLATKQTGDFRAIVNLQSSNTFLHINKFHMELSPLSFGV